MKTFLITLAGLLIFTVSSNGQLYSTQSKDLTLLVKGTAILKQMPELIYVSINIKSESQDYSDCQNKLLSKMEKVKSSILKQKFSKDIIKTNEISINERKEFINGKTVNTGFIGNVSVNIESAYSTEISNKLLAAFKTDSLFLNYTIAFRLSEVQKSQLRQQAIIMAIDDAKDKASLIAKSSNIKLLNINSITYLDDDMTYLRDRDIIREVIKPSQDTFLMVRGTDSNTPNIDFNPKEIGIIKSVRIEWTIGESENPNNH
jgi:uncharacterized protein YggE